jgi:hypothetical protein
MKKQLAILFFIGSTSAFSQTIFEPQGADSWSLGGSSVAQSNVFSVANNMAATNELSTLQIGAYNQLRFGLKELNTVNTTVLIPSKYFHYGIAFKHFGYQKYNQQCFDFGISKKVSKQFNLGITLQYVALNIDNQENAKAFTGSISAFYKPLKQLQLGALFFNPTQSKYNINGYGSIQSIARMGAKYEVNNQIYLMAELDKTIGEVNIFRSGINYALHKQFGVSLVYASSPNYFTFGFNAKVKFLDIVFASSLHSALGYTPHLSLVFNGR